MSSIQRPAFTMTMIYFNRALLAVFFLLSSSASWATTPSPVQPIAAVITVNGNTLNWTSTGAVAMNVHGGNGEWLESLPGHATSWQAPAAGEYFLVSTNRSSWETWPRSAPVQVVDPDDIPTTPPTTEPRIVVVNAPLSVNSAVYGDNVAELIWPGVASEHTFTHYQVFRNDELVHTTNGHSYFMDDLLPGTQYDFLVNALRTDGTTTIGRNHTLTTSGPATPPSSQPRIIVVNAPVSVNSVVYGETAAELFWPGIASEHTLQHYRVFRDGNLVETTTGHSHFANDLLPGTRYEFFVDAVRLDGSLTIGANHSFTTFGTAVPTAFGKPAEDRDTFGFSYWDRLNSASNALYPSDCLFALSPGDIPSVCFSPSSRELRFVTIGRRGSDVYWAFNLPGTNQSNRIEGLVWYNSNEFALVADTKLTFATTDYEISTFKRTGEFIATLPILPSFNASGTNSHRQINIDGQDLIVNIGQISSGGPNVSDVYDSIQVIGEYYEAVSGGDQSQRGGWDNVGAFIAQVDAQTGATLEIAFFNGQTAEGLLAGQ